jgi:hypothetical protein
VISERPGDREAQAVGDELEVVGEDRIVQRPVLAGPADDLAVTAGA